MSTSKMMSFGEILQQIQEHYCEAKYFFFFFFFCLKDEQEHT